MDIMMNLFEIKEKLDIIDSRFRYLWDVTTESEDGINGETYLALKELGNEINPIFTKDASARMESSGNRWYLIGRDYA